MNLKIITDFFYKNGYLIASELDAQKFIYMDDMFSASSNGIKHKHIFHSVIYFNMKYLNDPPNSLSLTAAGDYVYEIFQHFYQNFNNHIFVYEINLGYFIPYKRVNKILIQSNIVQNIDENMSYTFEFNEKNLAIGNHSIF